MKRTNNDRVQRIALEFSLKPFGLNDGRSYEQCAHHVITAWLPLLQAAEEVSFMLWVSDGSDILEWTGDFAQPLEWARYIGFCNSEYGVYHEYHHGPERNSILYTERPADFTYGDLRDIITALRRVGAELLGVPITIGATWDPGPEFAESPFKYARHPEIIVAKHVVGRPTFPMVDATATLHADDGHYAAFPDGIPEGESFAYFLGRQIAEFCTNLGYDYVWHSNGFAFSAVAWDYLGPAFDGESYHPEAHAERLAGFKQAWRDLKRGNPDIPMEVRGTNFTASMDISKDGVDYAWLYSEDLIRLPPPNSPWGALNFDFGLEITGYLSRAVKTPKGQYLFRYYPNDPWFWQNPWTDIFYGQPYDIYMPLASAIVNDAGKVTTPDVINILTGDTEFGDTDPLTGAQVGAHIRTALADKPDDVGLVTWVYPFDTYHHLAKRDAEGLAEVFFGDWYVRSAINNGLPVSTAATPEAFSALLDKRDDVPQTVVFMPTAAVHTDADGDHLFEWLHKGVPVVLYGPASSLRARVFMYLGLTRASPLSGELALLDEIGQIDTLMHDPAGSAGGLTANYGGSSVSKLLYSVTDGEQSRAYCVSAGKLTWIRGTLPLKTRPDKHMSYKPIPQDARYFDAGQLPAKVLAGMGYILEVCSEVPSAKVGQNDTMLLFSRHDRAWFLSGYAAAPVGTYALRFPQGAPIFHNTYTRIENGAAIYPLEKSWHKECRLFVQQESGIVGCTPGARVPGYRELTLNVTGLENATVTFLPPKGFDVTFEVGGDKSAFPAGDDVRMGGLSGTLVVRW